MKIILLYKPISSEEGSFQKCKLFFYLVSVNIPSAFVEKEKRSAGDFIFSIIIPSWNNLPYLKLCIESIRKNSCYHHQIIVHINEGTDGTREWINSTPDIDYSYSHTNIGVCYALNIARTLMTTEYLVYMNDDMYACPGWDIALYEEVMALGHKDFFLSCTSIEPRASGNNCVVEKDYGTDIQRFRESELLKEFNSIPVPDWQGSTWPPNIVHRDTWDLVGGYSVEFSPGFYSDPDFSMKLWTSGIRLFKGMGKSRVYHFGSVSTRRLVKSKGYYTFIRKWGMTAGTFTKQMLRRGEKFDGPLKDRSRKRGTIKNVFKQLESAVRGR